MTRSLLAVMIAAPLAVALLLRAGAGAGAVFAAYQVGVCLLVPAGVDLARRRWSWRRHLRHLGLTGPGALRAGALGLLLGAAGGGGILAFFFLWGGSRLGAADVTAGLAAWNLAPGDLSGVLVFMALVGGPAEELFWRGFCAAELAAEPSRPRRLLVPSLLYASYHAATVPTLMPHPGLAALALAAVATAGVGWAWLRERTGSVWPALLSHGAAAGAYVLVARRLLEA